MVSRITPRAPTAPRLPARPQPVSPGAGEFADELHLEDAAWHDPALAGESAEFCEVMATRVQGGDWSSTSWYRSSLVDVAIEGTDLANARFEESLWRRVGVRHGRLTGLSLAGCIVEDLAVEGCVANLLNVRFAQLTRVVFSGCPLTGIDLTTAKLTDVVFEDCDLTDAQFSQATCTRVRIDCCRLDGLRGVQSLKGATLAPLDLMALTLQLASALGITIDQGE